MWERKECISVSNPNFEEEAKLGITPNESFGKIELSKQATRFTPVELEIRDQRLKIRD